MKIIPDIVPFPDGAESSPFFGALASALVPALGYTETTTYFCGQKGSYCVDCGNCKNSTLQKHRCLLYHDYQSFTGVSFGWAWPEDESPYQTLPGWYKYFVDAVIITGRANKTVTYNEVLDRIIQTLEHPARDQLEKDLMAR